MGSFVSGSGAESKQLTEAFGLRGRAITSISGEISPVILAGPDAPPPYHTKRGGCFHNTGTGDAGFPGAVGIFNPPDSGTIVVLRRVLFSNQNVSKISVQIGPPTAGNQLIGTVTNPPVAWDSEPSGTGIVGIQRPVARMRSFQVLPLQLDPMVVVALAIAANLYVEGPWVLRVDRALVMSTLENAARIDVNFYWDEFPIL